MPDPLVFHTEQIDDDGKTFKITQHLDVRGMTCPMPALKSLERSKAMLPGEVLEVIGDWPGSKFEVPYAVADRPGLEIVRIIEASSQVVADNVGDGNETEHETWWIYIRRT